MGASQVGFLIFAPKRLEEDQRTESVRHFRNVQKEAKLIVEAKLTEETPLLLEMCKRRNLNVEDLKEMADEIVEMDFGVVEQIWNYIEAPPHQRAARDTMRRDVDFQNQVIFAGEMTWGDTPDGLGYQIISRIFLLGLDDILGIS